MKVVILAGGFGTRISEESQFKPKPMIEIGGRPILWHIMKNYSHYGFNDFIVCLGYKGHVIKEFFSNYYLHMSDVTFDFQDFNNLEIHSNCAEPWRVTLIETGLKTMTGGRVKRVRSFLDEDSFMLTYGDGVSDVDINDLVKFHRSHGRMATVTTIQPSMRFGALDLEENLVTGFREKPKGEGSWINGGFFVFEPAFLDFIEGDETVLETGPLERCANERQLMAYRHRGFWQPMDTMRDRAILEEIWATGNAPWKVWL